MEEALVKLIKVVMSNTVAACEFGCEAESIIDNILDKAELKLHEEARQELIEFAKKL